MLFGYVYSVGATLRASVPQHTISSDDIQQTYVLLDLALCALVGAHTIECWVHQQLDAFEPKLFYREFTTTPGMCFSWWQETQNSQSRGCLGSYFQQTVIPCKTHNRCCVYTPCVGDPQALLTRVWTICKRARHNKHTCKWNSHNLSPNRCCCTTLPIIHW